MRESESRCVLNGFNAANPISKNKIKSILKVIVKRTLRKHGYPPDMQLLATGTVLRQAKLIADELSSTNIYCKTTEEFYKSSSESTQW